MPVRPCVCYIVRTMARTLLLLVLAAGCVGPSRGTVPPRDASLYTPDALAYLQKRDAEALAAVPVIKPFPYVGPGLILWHGHWCYGYAWWR